MPERIVYHRAGSAAKAEAIIEHGFDRTSGDQYGVGLWTCRDPEMWKGGPVQFKLRVTYEREAYWDEVPEAGRAWTGNPEDVDNVYEAKGIDVVRRGEIDFLFASGQRSRSSATGCSSQKRGHGVRTTRMTRHRNRLLWRRFEAGDLGSA